MVNFKQAIEWLREGKRVYRPEWKPGTFWILGEDESIKCKPYNKNILENARVHINQINANDWLIYQEPEFNLSNFIEVNTINRAIRVDKVKEFIKKESLLLKLFFAGDINVFEFQNRRKFIIGDGLL